jgi:hypothetical protein
MTVPDTYVAGLLLTLAVVPALCQTRAADLQAAALRRYEARNAELSTPVPQPYATPYFTDNERGADKFYARFEGIGGVMLGTGFQQNFSYLVHGRPDLYLFFDINPDVTEILVPWFGQMMATSPTRREFLSLLTGVPFTQVDVRRLLEPRRGPGQDAEDLGSYLPGVVNEILDRVPREERRRRFEEQIGRMLARRIVTPSHRAQIIKWFDYVEEDMLSGGKFFEQSAWASWVAGQDRTRRDRLAGWLSTERSYRMVRRAWIEGRIVGVTGDIAGPSVGKLARWLHENGRAGSAVTFLYLSNIGASIMGHEKPDYFAQLYRTLGQLPLSAGAVTLIAQGNNVAHLRTFARARAFYDSLAAMDTGVMTQLVEIPLSYSVLGSAPDALRKFKADVAGFVANPSEYSALVDRLLAARAEVRGSSASAFEAWVKKQWPALDTTSDVFRALEALLAELGILSEA